MGEVKLIHNHYLEPRDASVDEISPIGNSKVGDFIGFTYNGKHSSELGIVRTSDGSRFNENLLPTMQDKTVQVPGADGTYYFGSYYTQRQFNVSFAFDSLTEFQVAQLKRHFGDKGIHDLIFDETPYKIYSAKVTGTATIKYIAFSEGETNRLYKGEGSIQFTCYDPFARSQYKFLKNYENDYENINEWKDASGMLETNFYQGKTIDDFSSVVSGFYVLNPGELEADWILTIYLDSTKIPNLTIGFDEFNLELNETSILTDATLIKINSKTNLIEAFKVEGGLEKKTGELCNHAIKSGAFFKIPISLKNKTGWITPIFEVKGYSFTKKPVLEYNYYYY